jgi:hypothetical protein
MKGPILLIMLVPIVLSSCNKPTSGQNTTEYRDGNSGATSETIKKDTPLDSTGKNKGDDNSEPR